MLLWDGGVRAHRIDAHRFVEIVSTNPARMFGLWPRKGTIAVGSDGDLVIWDNHAVQHGRPEVGDREARTLRRVCVGPEQDLALFAGRRVT